MHHRQDEIFARLAALDDVVVLQPKWRGRFTGVLSIWISLLKRLAVQEPVGVCWTGDLTVAGFAKELKVLGLARKFAYDDPDYFPVMQAGVSGGLLRIIDQRIIKGADLIMSCTPELARLRFEQGAKRVEMIPDGVDVKFFEQSFEARLNKCQGSEFKPRVLLFAGWFGIDRGLDVLPEALEIVLGLCPETELLITGTGTPHFLQKFHDAGCADHVKYLGCVPRSSLPGIFTKADIGLSLGTRPAWRYGMPHKIVEYLGSGLPVVATATPPTVRMLEGNNAAICVDSTAESVATGITRILKMSRDAYLEMCRAARSRSMSLDWRNLAHEYARKVIEVAQSP